jgi:hypothetical protein
MQPGVGQPGSVPPGGLFGGSGGAAGGTVATGGTGTAVVGEGTTPGAAPIAKTQRADEPQLAINLAGCFERWGIDAGTTLTSAKIEFKNVNVQQVKQILQRLPSSLKASLEVSYNEEAQS